MRKHLIPNPGGDQSLGLYRQLVSQSARTRHRRRNGVSIHNPVLGSRAARSEGISLGCKGPLLQLLTEKLVAKLGADWDQTAQETPNLYRRLGIENRASRSSF